MIPGTSEATALNTPTGGEPNLECVVAVACADRKNESQAGLLLDRFLIRSRAPPPSDGHGPGTAARKESQHQPKKPLSKTI